MKNNFVMIIAAVVAVCFAGLAIIPMDESDAASQSYSAQTLFDQNPGTITFTEATTVTISDVNDPYESFSAVPNSFSLSAGQSQTVQIQRYYEDETENESVSVIFSVSSGSTPSEEELSFVNTAPTEGISGSTYNYTASTNVAANFSKSGTWPSWLSLNTSTGKVSGTLPNVSSSTSYTVTIHAVSRTMASNTADQQITITVYPIATLSAAGGTTITGITGTSISKTISCNLGATFSIASGSNSLPAGLALSSAGVISGTPTQDVSNHRVTIKGATTSGPVQSPTIVLTFNIERAEDTLEITSEVPSGNYEVGQTVDIPLTANITGTVFSLTNAPNWLVVDSYNHIRGSVPSTYVQLSTETFTVNAVTPQGQTATQSGSISIEPVMKFTSKPTAACIAIPHYVYQDDGTVDAGIIDDLRDGYASVTSGKISGYTFVFVGNNADTVTWDFGDGTTAEGFVVDHDFSRSGTYVVTCTATNQYENEDEQIVTGTDVCTIEVTVDADFKDYLTTGAMIFVGLILIFVILKLIAAPRRR